MDTLISYHGSHSGEFCDHARSGITLQQVVEARIRKGYFFFGVTEHMPRDREEFLYPEEREARRTPEILRKIFDNYVAEAKRLQKTAAEQGVHILVGFETEYCNEDYPAYINGLREETDIDYIVGSVHHVQGIPFDYDAACYTEAMKRCGGLEKLYLQYYAQQLDLIEQCRPEVVGHFDLIKISSGRSGEHAITPAVSKQIDKNIEAIISYGGVFEVNSRGFGKNLGKPYPGAKILRRIREMDGKITLGDDSHDLDDIGRDYEKALSAVRKAGFEQIVAFRKKNGLSGDRSKSFKTYFEKFRINL